jgi:aryl-alcohol dehydrogenase-like predicted oxidoreductase
MIRLIADTGHTVNAVGLGAWQLSNVRRPGEQQAVEVIRASIEAGIDFIDTADCYCADDSEFGHNEHLVRQGVALANNPHVKIATKVGFRRPAGAWQTDGRPERITSCCDASLKRLETDCLFLYQLHRPDPQVPIEDTVGAMLELQKMGKIQHIGLSNVDQTTLERALRVARIETVQNECNPWVNTDIKSGLVAFCETHRISYLPYRPVGGGDQHDTMAHDKTLAELAARYQTSTYCVLLNWLLGLGSHVLPIPGATRLASVTDSLRATSFQMDASDQQRLHDVAA